MRSKTLTFQDAFCERVVAHKVAKDLLQEAVVNSSFHALPPSLVDFGAAAIDTVSLSSQTFLLCRSGVFLCAVMVAVCLCAYV
jgi:hypothetical protein